VEFALPPPRHKQTLWRYGAAVLMCGGDQFAIEVAKTFANEGLTLLVGGSRVEEMIELVKTVRDAGGTVSGRVIDRTSERDVVALIEDADRRAPLRACIVDVGGGLEQALVDTPSHAFRSEWENKCYAGFLACRESARRMLRREAGGCIIVTGRSDSRVGRGFRTATASARFGVRAMTEVAARELGPENIHVAHLVLDGRLDGVRPAPKERTGGNAPEALILPQDAAKACLQLYRQSQTAWTFEQEIRPYTEPW
jgi:NAD(P)-dependent dehydrogenase (short-subunit alcohol dehydrogenase family)